MDLLDVVNRSSKRDGETLFDAVLGRIHVHLSTPQVGTIVNEFSPDEFTIF